MAGTNAGEGKTQNSGFDSRKDHHGDKTMITTDPIAPPNATVCINEHLDLLDMAKREVQRIRQELGRWLDEVRLNLTGSDWDAFLAYEFQGTPEEAKGFIEEHSAAWREWATSTADVLAAGHTLAEQAKGNGAVDGDSEPLMTTATIVSQPGTVDEWREFCQRKAGQLGNGGQST